MPDDNQQLPEDKSMGFGVIKLYVDRFGMLAFGLLTVILMQVFIVAPQVERAKLDQEKAAKDESEKQSLLKELRDLAEHLRRTAELLDQNTLRRERLQ